MYYERRRLFYVPSKILCSLVHQTLWDLSVGVSSPNKRRAGKIHCIIYNSATLCPIMLEFDAGALWGTRGRWVVKIHFRLYPR